MAVAYIGKVIKINPIKGADRIESLEVVCGKGGKWRGIAGKGLRQVDDLVEVYLQDAILPKEDRFLFMEKHKYIVKMQKFKGVPSECLIMPTDPKLTEQPSHSSASGHVGQPIPNIEKYEKPIPANLAGEVLGQFPTHLVPKTDEPNFQTVPEMVEALKGKQCYVTVKCDGSSATFYKHEGHFGVCSRNLELKDTENNTLWELVRKYDICAHLSEDFAIQVECIGEGIQSNPMGIKGHDIRIFNIYDIKTRRYLGYKRMMVLAKMLQIPTVPYICEFEFGDPSDEDLRKLAVGNYDNGKPREGIVIRPMEEMVVNGERLSFKVINLLCRDID